MTKCVVAAMSSGVDSSVATTNRINSRSNYCLYDNMRVIGSGNVVTTTRS